METFEIGRQVIIDSKKGKINGEVCYYWRNNTKNQFCVKFEYNGIKQQQCFSKKTGKLYNGDHELKNEQLKVII